MTLAYGDGDIFVLLRVQQFDQLPYRLFGYDKTNILTVIFYGFRANGQAVAVYADQAQLVQAHFKFKSCVHRLRGFAVCHRKQRLLYHLLQQVLI